MAKVLVADPIDENAIRTMREAGLEIVIRNKETDPPLEDQIKGFDCIIVRSATKVTKSVIQAADTLKLIVRAGVGLDNVDTQAAEAKGIKVSNTPEAPTISVAELVFAQMFALARKITLADSSMKKQQWAKKTLMGTELWRKTLGIIGFGRIGVEVAKRAKAFGMRVLAYDVLDIESICYKLGIKNATFDEILEQSDFITVHVPLLPQTKGLIGEKEISKMKPTAFLINTARGGVVDETALLTALDDGKIAGAGLDVFEVEPPTDWRLVQHPKIVATPHIASSTKEAQARVGELTAAKVISAFKK